DTESTNRGGISEAGYAYGLAFAGTHGWLWQTRGFAYMSVNGGRKWTPIDFTRPDTTIEIVDVAAVSPSVVYALVRRGWKRYELRASVNGGGTWRLEHVWRYR